MYGLILKKILEKEFTYEKSFELCMKLIMLQSEFDRPEMTLLVGLVKYV